MHPLVSLEGLKAFLGIDADDETDDVLLTQLVAGLVALFEAAVGRESAPFAAAQLGRVEVLDGTGLPELFLDYDIQALTSVVIGADPTDPVETLDVNDRWALAWRAGNARLARIDGGVFARYGAPECVHVTYDAKADLPADVTLLLHRVVATIYRQRGGEDARTESAGGASTELAQLVAGEPLWDATVNAHRRRRF